MSPPAPDSGSLAIRCGTLIDGLADQPRSDVTVVIEDGKIVAVGDGEQGAVSVAEDEQGTAIGTVPQLGAVSMDLAQYTCLAAAASKSLGAGERAWR